MMVLNDTLPSGLRFIAEELPQMESTAIAISVDVGARWESPEQHGISHLLEHMAFKGTKRYSALQIAEIFDGIGGHFNAFTSHEHTVYYVKVLKEHWHTASAILCEILTDSLYDEEELAREKGVILQELAMHHDTPDDLVFDLYQEAAFGSQPLGRSILGTAEAISAHPRQAILDFVTQHYRAPRICVSAAGAMDAVRLRDFFAEHLALPAGDENTLPPANYLGGEQIVDKDLEQLQLLLGVPSLPIADVRYYALQLLSNLLGGGMSSRLFQEIREKRGLVYTIQSFNASYAECGLLSIYAATSPEDAPELMEVVTEELRKLTQDISSEELARSKQQQIANLRMARENTATLAEWMGRHMLQFGEYRDATALTERIEAVQLEEVQTLAQSLFAAPKLSFAALGPTKSLMAADDIAAKLVA